MEKNIKEISTPALAYLGDSVIELYVRKLLVERGLSSSRTLNLAALTYVTASAQASAIARILPLLDEEENAVYHRGRNIGHTNVPKRATVAEYRKATGFETLFGYLYLMGRVSRLEELFRAAYEEVPVPAESENDGKSERKREENEKNESSES